MDKLHLADLSIFEQHAVYSIHSILSRKDEFNSINLSDGTTKLVDLLSAMIDYDGFSEFMRNLPDVNATVPRDSPFGHGYTVLHLAVFMGENTKFLEESFKKSDSQQKLDSTLQVDKTTEEDRRKYRERINVCLESGCSVTIKDANGTTPIHLAFKLHKVEIINLLLDRCETNSGDRDDLSFLHIACATGNMDAVIRLLSIGADIDSRTRISFDWFYKCPDHSRNSEAEFITVPMYSTALHIAAIFQYKTIVQLLLELEADVYAQNALGLTPIHLSMNSCHERSHKNPKSIARAFLKRAPNLMESLSDSGLSHLHIAAYADDADAIEKLLQLGANIDSVFKVTVPELSFLARYANRTPLHVATLMRSHNAITTLVESGADIFKRTPEIRTPLQAVLHDFYYEMPSYIESKFKHSKRFNEAIDENGVTLLHVACRMRDFEWIEKLLKKGADVNARILNDHEEAENWNGFTPMDVLIDTIVDYMTSGWEDRLEGIEKFAKLLIEYGANLPITSDHAYDSSLLFALYMARENLDDDDDHEISEQHGAVLLPIADLLLNNQPSYKVNPVNPEGFSHFHYACMRNEVDVVKNFLDNGIDINLAANVKFGQKRGAKNFTPLHVAVYFRSVEVACLLIERGANVNAVNTHGETPLHIAAIRGLLDHLFEMLLSNGADINACTTYRSTPIHGFFENNNEITYEQLKFFLVHGSSIDLANDKCQGLFGLAMKNAKTSDREAIFEELIDLCDVKNAVKNNYNPIESIAAVVQDGKLTVSFYLNAIQRFIDMKCKLDQQNKEGKTALHQASAHENFEAVEALLLLGTNVNIIDKDNKPPIRADFSSDRGARTAKLLADHMWKMKFIGLKVHKVCEAVMLKIHQEFPLEEHLHVRRCENELASLSRENIGESITMKCFLHEWGAAMDYPRMSFFQRHNVDQFFEKTDDLRQNFPEFCRLLMMQYRKAVTRDKMFKIAMNVLPSVLQVNLPYLCLENVLKYFDNDELGYFIKGHIDQSTVVL